MLRIEVYSNPWFAEVESLGAHFHKPQNLQMD